MSSISVIIPTLNEINGIQSCLHQPALKSFNEIIIADASTTPLELTQLSPSIHLISAPKGRATQMNAAANLASSDILLFLHADTFLPDKAYDLINSAISEGNIAGCFNRSFTPSNPLLKFTSKIANLRAKHLFWAYGDQAIFITRKAFQQLNGYPDLQSFEDLELCIRSKKIGPHTVISSPIQTSARRFKKGTLTTLTTDLISTINYLITRK